MNVIKSDVTSGGSRAYSPRASSIAVESISRIFDFIPDVLFYTKNRERRWLSCNRAAELLLMTRGVSDVRGRREDEFFPQLIAESILKDDLSVIETGAIIVDRTETVLDQDGRLAWVSTTKLPLRDAQGDICGLVGVTRIVNDPDRLNHECRELSPVLSHIDANYAAELTIPALARIASLSPNQLRDRFRKHFRLSPVQFINRVRLHAASRLLVETHMSVVDIAIGTGFCDQNYFTRQFRNYFGVPPHRFRTRRWTRPAGSDGRSGEMC